jgi:hypothetical protein
MGYVLNDEQIIEFIRKRKEFVEDPATIYEPQSKADENIYLSKLLDTEIKMGCN